MTFKEQATADLPTFLNVDEFADTADIDGVAVACVFDGEGDTVGSQDGIVNVDEVLYARAVDFETLPVVGQRLTIDDEQADVVAVSEDQGIVKIRLRWFDS